MLGACPVRRPIYWCRSSIPQWAPRGCLVDGRFPFATKRRDWLHYSPPQDRIGKSAAVKGTRFQLFLRRVRRRGGVRLDCRIACGAIVLLSAVSL